MNKSMSRKKKKNNLQDTNYITKTSLMIFDLLTFTKTCRRTKPHRVVHFAAQLFSSWCSEPERKRHKRGKKKTAGHPKHRERHLKYCPSLLNGQTVDYYAWKIYHPYWSFSAVSPTRGNVFHYPTRVSEDGRLSLTPICKAGVSCSQSMPP